MLNSFKLKLVAYFAVLSLLPLGAAFWGFTTVAGTSETRTVDARLQAGLRAALAAYQDRLDGELRAAQHMARLRRVQLDLERRDRRALTALLADASGLSVTAPGGFKVGGTPGPAIRQSVQVVTARGPIGTITASIPLDHALVASLRVGSGLGRADVLALLRGGRIVAAEPGANGAVELAPGRIATARVGGVRYRTLVAPQLVGAPSSRLVVLSPQSLIDAAGTASRDRLLLGLLACLALISVVAYLEGRSIVRTLRTLSQAAHGIARGRFSERVPVRGRDEFARLGEAFNQMAEELEQRLAELQAERGRLDQLIARFGEALSATHDADQLLRVIASTAVEATGATGVHIGTADGAVAESGDLGGGADRIEVALTVGGERLGSLLLVGERFDGETRAAAATLATHAAIALDNARLHRIVELQARVDGLTGLANRRRCEEALHREIALADRAGTPLSLVVADIDGFKTVNDVYGHASGDETLRTFGALLSETVRESDVAGRWGGEEFVLVLPGTDIDGAVRLADRVRIALAARPIAGPRGDFRVTASFGVAAHRKGDGTDGLFAAADRALYRAKREGKDRVEVESLSRNF